MATIRMIPTPAGKRCRVTFDTEEDRKASAEQLLSKWSPYCNENWLSNNHEDPQCSEKRVKAFLGGVADLLLRGHCEGTLSKYKEMARGSSEIPVSSCPENVRSLYYGEESAERSTDKKTGSDPTNKPLAGNRKNMPGASQNAAVDEIHTKLADGVFYFERIDTENVFHHDGKAYQLDPAHEAYKPKETREGLLYDMDTIVVVERKGVIHFFTQNYESIDAGLIWELPA